MTPQEAQQLIATIQSMVQQPQAQPFANQPQQNIGGLYCPVHGAAAVMKPAGFRKDGTSYPSFPVCPDPSCRARPVRQNAPQAPTAGPYAPQGQAVAPDSDLPF